VITANDELHNIVLQTRFHLFFIVVFNIVLLLCLVLLMVFVITAFRPRDQDNERLLEEHDEGKSVGGGFGENVVCEGLVYEPYTQATLNILATEDAEIIDGQQLYLNIPENLTSLASREATNPIRLHDSNYQQTHKSNIRKKSKSMSVRQQ